MKISNLHIDGFGHFANRKFGPFEQPVTVFYGPNEAGKTTLLEFIRSVLFGFLNGRSSRNLYRPMAGGRHGGSITIESDAGETVSIQRAQGRAGGTVTLTGETGNPISSAELPLLIGNHSKDVFESIFAFTIDQLHDEALLKDESVNSQIYSAGMGASKLPDAFRTLERQKDDLFLHRGSRHAIYVAASNLDQVESDLGKVGDNAVEYGREKALLVDVERELATLRERRLSTESHRQNHANLQRAWEPWNDLIIAEQHLAELPDISDFPTNGIGRLETLEAQIVSARGELDTAAARVRSVEESATLQIEHESILEQSEAVRDLERRRAAFDQSVKDVPERQTELAGLRAALDNTLSDLGPDWNAERLTEFDLSIIVREEASTYASRLRESRQEISQSTSALAAAETALNEARQSVERAQNELAAAPEPAFDEAGMRERRSRVRALRNTLDAHARRADRTEDLHSQLGAESDPESAQPASSILTKKLVAFGSGALGVIIAIAGVVLGMGDWMSILLSVVFGVAMLGVAIYLLLQSDSPSKSAASPDNARVRNRLAEEEQRLAKLRVQLEEEAAALGIDPMDETYLAAAEDTLDLEQVRLDRRERVSATLRDAEQILRQRMSRRDESAETVEVARSAAESAGNDWKRWLTDRGLRHGFSPDRFPELSGLVELGRTRHAEVDSMEQRIAAIQTDIQEFLYILRPLSATHGFDLPPGDYPRAAAIADDLIDLHGKVSEKSRDRDAAADDLKAARAEFAEREARLKDAQDKIDTLLKSGGARDVEEFRRRAEIYGERGELNARIYTARDQLQRITGPGDTLESLQAELAQTNLRTIGDDIRRVDDELSDISDRIESLVARRSEIQSSLKNLLGEEDSSRLRAERYRLMEEIRSHAREWAVRTIAENLLKEAQSKFEKERQPDVVRHSMRFFRDITNGRYQTVFSPLGTSEIHVTDFSGASKQPAQLSRGSREQLFLALRFGLILELGGRAERLPVIVDEVMVNFDPDRALRAAHAFVELSQTNQVLAFTCHPWVVELFQIAASQAGAPEPHVVKIQ